MRYSSIIYNDTVNGEGLRMSFFCQGCSLKCRDCFQKELQDFNGGVEFTESVLQSTMDYFDMFKEGLDGITLIGGEIMQNTEFGNLVATTFKERFPDKTIWFYSGYTLEEILKDKNKKELLEKGDVLVDGRFIEQLKNPSLKYRGSSNQRVIDVKKSLRQNRVVLFTE